MPGKRKHRLFFALWPDQETRDRLYQSQQSIGLSGQSARYVPAANLHMTLHFIGQADAAFCDCLMRVARRVKGRAFSLKLDRTGHFKKPQISWLGCQQLPHALLELHRELAKQLRACDFRAERRPYVPHVTLARKQAVASDVSTIGPVDWPINDFSLVESTPLPGGVRYDVLETYPLND